MKLILSYGEIPDLVFLPMDETDFNGFAGVQNDNALICYGADYTLILDGDRVCYINGDWEESKIFWANTFSPNTESRH